MIFLYALGGIFGVLLAALAVLFILVQFWRRTPYGNLNWKIAASLRFLHRKEKKRKESKNDLQAYRRQTKENMLRFAKRRRPGEREVSVKSAAAEVVATDSHAKAGGRTIPLRIYSPVQAARGPGQMPAAGLPVIVFFHGGGFVAGDLDSHDPFCRDLCFRSSRIVVAVGYRLAPEYPFPAAVDDAFDAVHWVSSHAEEFGGDPGSIAVMGDSSGGTLAAVTSLRARDAGGPAIRLQVLIYPSTKGCAMDMESHKKFGKGYLLDLELLEWFCDQYVPKVSDRSHPYASPLTAEDLSGLPGAVVITPQFDPLRDEGKAYADLLREAGVPVRYACFDGVIHGFVGIPRICPEAEKAMNLLVQELDKE
jgi:acetyl esterase